MSYFLRYAEIEFLFDEKTFRSPPFSVEFTVRHSLFKLRTISINLYNPNDETVELCKAIPDQSGKPAARRGIILRAGYEKDNRIDSYIGEIRSFNVKWEGPDRILTIEMIEVPQWNEDVIGKPFRDENAVGIIFKLKLGTGTGTGNVSVGKDKFYKKLVITDPMKSVEAIAKDTDSVYYWIDGELNFLEADMPPSGSLIEINEETGLLESPEAFEIPRKQTDKEDHKKPDIGYKLKTIYLPGVGMGDSVDFPVRIGGSFQGIGRIFEVGKSFSSFGDASFVYKVKAKQQTQGLLG